eukprot:1159596-Pelagomonas_calceolata.AAC.2
MSHVCVLKHQFFPTFLGMLPCLGVPLGGAGSSLNVSGLVRRRGGGSLPVHTCTHARTHTHTHSRHLQTQLVAGKDDGAEEEQEEAAGPGAGADAKHDEGLEDMALIEDYLKARGLLQGFDWG